MADVVCFLV